MLRKQLKIKLSSRVWLHLHSIPSFIANTTTVIITFFGGLTNISTAISNFVGFGAIQATFEASNYEQRKKNINKLREEFDDLKSQLENRYNYRVQLENPNCFDEVGLHFSIGTTISSSALVLANLGLAAGAMATSLVANRDDLDNSKVNFDEICSSPNRTSAIEEVCQSSYPIICTHGLCITSYVLGAAAAGFATIEQHIKKANLERWENTLIEGIKTLQLKLEEERIEEDNTSSRNSITLSN